MFWLPRCEVHRGQLTSIPSLHFGRLGGGLCSALPQALPVCWYREHLVMLKEAVLEIQRDPPGSKCHLSQGRKRREEEEKGRGKEGLCNLHLHHGLEELPFLYCCWHFTVKKIKCQFSLEEFKRMASASECRFTATLRCDWIVEQNNFL